jgi:acyl CoA:acetate/3-ketoacid CoA transferase
VVTGGFVGIGFPEHVAAALERRFQNTGTPADHTLVFAARQGDGKSRGLNHFGHRGMVRRVIGGHRGARAQPRKAGRGRAHLDLTDHRPNTRHPLEIGLCT